MKRTARLQAIAFALILVMLTGILPPTVFAAGNVRFDDVKPTDWFYSAVEAVCGNGLMTGTTSRTFSPNQPVTRGMLVTILHRLENYPKTASISSFMDVPAGAYYEKAICWAAANKIVTGYDDTHFGPDDALTREQLAAILYRYADAMGYDVSSSRSHTLYADAAAVSDYAQAAVDWSVAEGFLKGKDGRKLCPKSAATRAEMAVILTRFCSYAEQQSAARLNAVVAVATYLPEENSDSGLSIRFDRHETVTTQPSVTLSGTYASDADVASITYTLTGEYSDFLDATGDVTYADGRWEITDLLIVPDNSTVTLIITDIDGNSASATGSVYYDLGELVDPELVEVERDEETGLIFASNILLVYFADEASDADKAAVARSVGGTVVGQDNFMNMQQLMVEPVTLEEAIQIADKVEEEFTESVVMAMFDLALINSSLSYDVSWDDPWDAWDYKDCLREGDGWNESSPAGNNWGFEAIEALSAWRLYGDEFEPILVGVVDNMFDTTHKDLEGKISFPNEDVKTINEKNLEEMPDNHGTHVAGTIASIAGNGVGITGIAHNASIVAYPYAVRWNNNSYDEFLDKGEIEFTSNLQFGLMETFYAGAKVINFSVSLTQCVEHGKLFDKAYKTLVRRSARLSSHAMSRLLKDYLPVGKDFLVVQSSGNGTADHYACDATKSGAFASIDKENCLLTGGIKLNQILDRIIVVGNADIEATPSKGDHGMSRYIQNATSNAGERVDLCAPGTDIVSCSITKDKYQYRLLTGTSQAAPHVTAVAALVWSANNALTAPQVKQILCSSYNTWVKDTNGSILYNSMFTGGEFPMVNARLSVKKALEMKYANKTDTLRATIVEGPTVDGLKASTVRASMIESTAPDKDTDPMKCRIRLEIEWSQNTSVYIASGVERRVGKSFTQAEIDATIAGFRLVIRLPDNRQPPGLTGEEFEWSRAENQYPIYNLILLLDRDSNVLGYTIVKIEKV